MQFIQFMKNLAIEGGLIYAAVFGAGASVWMAGSGGTASCPFAPAATAA